MKCKSCCSQFFKLFDLFSLTQFLRYNQDEDYKTVSGGITSLIVVSIFGVLFAGNALSTINKTEVFWQATKQNSFKPTPTNMEFSSESKNMFSVGIPGLDVNNPNFRYFDFEIAQTNIVNDIYSELKVISMEPCTIQHFSQTEQIKNNFHLMKASQRVCVPLNHSFPIDGKNVLQNITYIQVRVKQCSNSSNSTIPCANQTVLNNLMAANGGRVYVNLFYINPLINPGNIDYLDYDINDLNYLSFDFQTGGLSTGFIEDFEIETDQSLLPFTQTRTQKGTRIEKDFIKETFSVQQGFYAIFEIAKSSSKVVFKRSFNKVDEFFSYVGGLIGTILGLMLFMGNFSLMSFELDVAQRFLRDSDGRRVDFSGFSVFSYFGYLLFRAGSLCGLCQGWREMRRKIACREEMIKQLDVRLFLQRFNYLQRGLQCLLQKFNLQTDQLYKPQTINMIIKRRRKYKQRKQKQQQNENNNSSISEHEEDDSSSDSEQQNGEINQMSNLNFSLNKLNQSDMGKQKNQIIKVSNHDQIEKQRDHPFEYQKCINQAKVEKKNGNFQSCLMGQNQVFFEKKKTVIKKAQGTKNQEKQMKKGEEDIDSMQFQQVDPFS